MDTTSATTTVKVGDVGVDSGQVMIVDPCYVLKGDFDDKSQGSYGAVCDVTLSEDGYGEFIATGIAGNAIASSSGYGDGNYPVYGEINGDGRVVALHIYFDEDPHTGELSYTSQFMVDNGLRDAS